MEMDPIPWKMNTMAVRRLNYCGEVSSGSDFFIILLMKIKLKLKNSPAKKLNMNMLGKPTLLYFSSLRMENKFRSSFLTANFVDTFSAS